MNDEQIQEMTAALHGATIRLLRTVRREDRATGISPPRLSALSVIAFAGPLSLGELAAAEEVKPPTMSRIVEGLVRDGLVTREADASNRRSVRIAATDEGRKRLEQGRAQRIRVLGDRFKRLAESEQRALARGIDILNRAI